MSFFNHKSVFLQILFFSFMKDNSSVLFYVKRDILCTKDQSKCIFLRLLSAEIKIRQILVIFDTTNRFFVKFYITLLYVMIQRKFYILSIKGAYQSTNLVKFDVSSRKSDILHFDGLLLPKSYKLSAKKYRRVISHDT